jgi:hypothetical protein
MTDPSFEAPFVTKKLEQLSSAHWLTDNKIKNKRIAGKMNFCFIAKSSF